jgi:HD-like signal output (HDOD) protein
MQQATIGENSREAILRAAGAVGIVGGGPGAAPRLLARLCDPAVDSSEIVAITGRDPGLTVRVLRVANSAYYGRSRMVRTVGQAVTLLGLDSVRGIAAAACLDRVLLHKCATAEFDVPSLVGHSLATAVLAEQLARGPHPALAGEAFIAGLLHNLGTLVQLQLHPLPMRRLLQRHERQPVLDIRELEQHAQLTSHEDCARVVFEDWSLPESLTGAAGDHHSPLSAEPAHRPLAALLHLAAGVAASAGYGWTLEPQQAAFAGDCRALLEIPDDAFDTVVAELPARVALIAGARD